MIYNHKPSAYFHKYAFEKITPLYPFGFGLSYTTFEYSTPQLSEPVLSPNSTVSVSVEVSNTGNYDGEEVVQMYIRDQISSATRPVKELKEYKRILIKKGESKTVSFKIDKETLAFYDINMNYCVEPGDFTIMIGSSSDKKDLKATTLSVNTKMNVDE
jgi:beta-glucosidase